MYVFCVLCPALGDIFKNRRIRTKYSICVYPDPMSLPSMHNGWLLFSEGTCTQNDVQPIGLIFW